MGEQGVNLAGLRQKICLGDGFASLILAEFGQEPLKFLHVTIDRGAELQIGPVAPTDFVECLGTAADVDPPREGIGFAAAIAVPGGGGGGMIDHPRDIERNRFQPLRWLRGFGGGIGGNRRFLAVRAREKIRYPAAAFGSFSVGRRGSGARPLRPRARGLRSARWFGRTSGFDAPGRYRLGGAFGIGRSRLRNVVCAAGASHDFAQRLERLDLIGDGTPHGSRLLRRLLRQIGGATAQGFAGRFEFALDLARHIAQLRRRGLETLRGLPENACELRIGLLAGSAPRPRRALAPLLYI